MKGFRGALLKLVFIRRVREAEFLDANINWEINKKWSRLILQWSSITDGDMFIHRFYMRVIWPWYHRELDIDNKLLCHCFTKTFNYSQGSRNWNLHLLGKQFDGCF